MTSSASPCAASSATISSTVGRETSLARTSPVRVSSPAPCPVLPDVTAALLQQRTEFKVAPVTLAEAKAMPVAFATNTSIGVRAISTIDDTPMAIEHPVLTMLRETYLPVPGEEL
ncbi:hypothetical protein ACFV7R_34660 [Streptomyces sp. NPDC059866]|uniref:hypothetical protein n=1 Tax=Streptomyces sp. NPDC059866 TaxID=3346978 RepID=UPI003659177E